MSMKKQTIAVDAMGGDHAPELIVRGAVDAASAGISVLLFGSEEKITVILDRYRSDWRSLSLSIVHCSQSIGMADQPGRAVLKYKDSSIVQGMEFLKKGMVGAFVSAGNSGAILAAALFQINRVDRVIRPAIATFLPSVVKENSSFLALDLGGTVDCRPEHLQQFALMGHAYVAVMQEMKSPRVALLSNGHEPYKGSAAVKTAYDLLRKTASLNFVGNVEARDIFFGHADVIVCDGFVGNIMLKTAQGTVKAIKQLLANSVQSSFFSRITLGFAASTIKKAVQPLDYTKKGGALILGIKKPVIVAHGSSNQEAMFHAIMQAHRIAHDSLFDRVNQEIAALLLADLAGDQSTSKSKVEREMVPD
jgi:phosphate acyltransferase